MILNSLFIIILYYSIFCSIFYTPGQCDIMMFPMFVGRWSLQIRSTWRWARKFQWSCAEDGWVREVHSWSLLGAFAGQLLLKGAVSERDVEQLEVQIGFSKCLIPKSLNHQTAESACLLQNHKNVRSENQRSSSSSKPYISPATWTAQRGPLGSAKMFKQNWFCG